MQGTVVMLLALSGLGCHHKKVETSYVESCYSSSTCYTSGCYSSSYSGSSCYSSCYSGGYSGCYSSCYSGAAYSPAEYSCYSCYSSCYSSKRHKHGLFGHKRKSCGACYEPAPVVASGCDPCSSSYGGPAVYGTYTPVYDGYASGQYIGSPQGYPAPSMSSQAMPAAKAMDTVTPAPSTPEAPSPGNPAPNPVTPPANPIPSATPAPGA